MKKRITVMRAYILHVNMYYVSCSNPLVLATKNPGKRHAPEAGDSSIAFLILREDNLSDSQNNCYGQQAAIGQIGQTLQIFMVFSPTIHTILFHFDHLLRKILEKNVT